MSLGVEVETADILVVDDATRDLHAVWETMLAHGYRVRIVPESAAAMEAMLDRPPDLIVMDVSRPEVKRFQLCQLIKSNPRFSDIPVIIVSTLNDIESRVEAFQHGAADFVAKPYLIEELHVRMRHHLRQKRKFDALNFRAGHDTLTGLPNRGLLVDRLQQAISYAERYERKLAVSFVDLDRFKHINDTLGHEVGDLVLIEVSRRLLGCVRESDTVARLGGDEFVMILFDQANEDVTLSAMQRILKSVTEPIATKHGDLETSCSIGFAFYPQDGRDPDTLIRNADAAMYRAKSLGRNNFQFFTSELHARMNERLELESDLRHALGRNEFELVYQPRVDLHTGRLNGVEALLRWNHPRRGHLRPAEFVSLAEEIDIMPSIGSAVILEACQQQVRWKVSGCNDLPISVNLSAKQLLHPDFVRVVRETILDSGIDPRQLELEMTESVAMKDGQRTLEIMDALRADGVHFSIDDFGSDNTRLNFLKKCPLTYIKLDPSFVNNVTSDPQDLAVASAIISMAHSLKMAVIAEGVETAAQVSLLADRGCDGMAGRFVCETLSGVDMTTMLSSKGAAPNLQQVRRYEHRTLLLVDDETFVIAALERSLRPQGFHILKASCAEEAFEVLAANEVGVIICDQQMPGMTGVDFFGNVRSMYPSTIRIVLTANANLGAVMDAINIGSVYKFLHKPWDQHELCEIVDEAFRRYEANRSQAAEALAAAM